MEMVPTMSNNQKHLKKAKLRHAEYYDMQSVQDALYAQSRQGKKFDNLMELITSEENIIMAYRNLKKNHGSRTAGTDRRTIKDLSHLGHDTLIRLVRRKFDYYRPSRSEGWRFQRTTGKPVPSEYLQSLTDWYNNAFSRFWNLSAKPNSSTEAMDSDQTEVQKMRLHSITWEYKPWTYTMSST